MPTNSSTSGSGRSGRVVLVTGAAHGIGKGIAEAFAGAGDSVIVADLNRSGAESVAREITAQTQAETLALEVDVRDSGGIQAMVAAAIQRFGRIDVLVNCAGIYPNSAMFDLAEAEWDRVFDVNVKGVFLVSRAVAAEMIKLGPGGRIINISSGAAISARPGAAHYCASKAAVNMLTKVLALELAPHGITVNAIAPGLIEVPDWDLNETYINALVSAMPVGRIGQPSDVANGALFLASPDSAFVTGSILAIDGGSSAGRSVPLSSKAGEAEQTS